MAQTIDAGTLSSVLPENQVREWEAKVDVLKRTKQYLEKDVAFPLLQLFRQYGILEPSVDTWESREGTKKEQENCDDMGRMLTRLHIDHALIGYTAETGTFDPDSDTMQ
ncbi:hypothetical protein DFQ29_006236 [Apophysomyces sp. BC1021]|nr:hypothetical protein DFQ29_006236 [Apophysomyces sp. BC1021]